MVQAASYATVTILFQLLLRQNECISDTDDNKLHEKFNYLPMKLGII